MKVVCSGFGITLLTP
nr:hypothetical protein [Vibrio parahaemolyticus]